MDRIAETAKLLWLTRVYVALRMASAMCAVFRSKRNKFPCATPFLIIVNRHEYDHDQSSWSLSTKSKIGRGSRAPHPSQSIFTENSLEIPIGNFSRAGCSEKAFYYPTFYLSPHGLSIMIIIHHPDQIPSSLGQKDLLSIIIIMFLIMITVCHPVHHDYYPDQIPSSLCQRDLLSIIIIMFLIMITFWSLSSDSVKPRPERFSQLRLAIHKTFTGVSCHRVSMIILILLTGLAGWE